MDATVEDGRLNAFRGGQDEAALGPEAGANKLFGLQGRHGCQLVRRGGWDGVLRMVLWCCGAVVRLCCRGMQEERETRWDARTDGRVLLKALSVPKDGSAEGR